SDHFGAGKQRASVAEFGVNKLRLDREHIAKQPDIELLIRDKAAQKAHGHMGMSVDQARNDRAARTVVNVRRGVALHNGMGWSHSNNRVAQYGDSPARDDLALLVHGDNSPINKEKIDGFYLWHEYSFLFLYYCL